MPDANANEQSKRTPLEIGDLIPHIEALVFASDKPLPTTELTELLNAAFGFADVADKVSEIQVQSALDGIVEKYSPEGFPFEVRQSGGGWQFLTKKAFHKTVAQLNGEKFLKKLSAAALETLAIIAYKQPITKGEIEAIRGVSSDYSVQKLLEKDLIIISGRNEKLPGHPLVYATSKNFMDYFGINSTHDLPKIKEVLAEPVVEPSVVHTTEEPSALRVTGEGELIDAEETTALDGHESIAGEARLFIDESHATAAPADEADSAPDAGTTPPDAEKSPDETAEPEA
jgi:segregation and condensation protein B